MLKEIEELEEIDLLSNLNRSFLRLKAEGKVIPVLSKKRVEVLIRGDLTPIEDQVVSYWMHVKQDAKEIGIELKKRR